MVKKLMALFLWLSIIMLIREADSQLTARGKPAIMIVSDMPNSGRTAYIGLVNRAVGRTVALLLVIIKNESGKIALIAGSRSYKTDEERELGFLIKMEEAFQQYEKIGVREGHDNRDENYQHAVLLLKEYPDWSKFIMWESLQIELQEHYVNYNVMMWFYRACSNAGYSKFPHLKHHGYGHHTKPGNHY